MNPLNDSRDHNNPCTLILISRQWKTPVRAYYGRNVGQYIKLEGTIHNLVEVSIVAFTPDGWRFNPFTTNDISSNPNLEEERSDRLYRLRIARIERYNLTRFRCRGLNKGTHRPWIHSQVEWKLVVPGELDQLLVRIWLQQTIRSCTLCVLWNLS